MLVVMMAREELVVLVDRAELGSETAVFVSASCAGAATILVVKLLVVCERLFTVMACVEVLGLAVVDDDLGIAVQRRPWIVVRNAPSGSLLDAIFWSRPQDERYWRFQSL